MKSEKVGIKSLKVTQENLEAVVLMLNYDLLCLLNLSKKLLIFII